MRPTKLSTNVFLELPPVLSHYIQSERNLWVEGNPRKGQMTLLDRMGQFVDVEASAVERRNMIQIMGLERTRALTYRTGFEQGRRDASRHYGAFGENTRLALQSSLVFGQLKGQFVAEPVSFEYDLESGTLMREVVLTTSAESFVHRMSYAQGTECGCWSTVGYISGHISELVGHRVITLEQACVCKGDSTCRLISRFDSEWGDEANWAREAMTMMSVDDELSQRDALVEQAQQAAQTAQVSLSDVNRRVRSDLLMESIVANSEAMQPVTLRMRQLMSSEAPVMIVGEPGTGRETLAKAVHFGGARKKQPFVVVDCLGLTGNALAQELFGYEEGVVSSAARGHTGALARADGGTLFLNDVSALTPEIQGLLLRALGQGEFTPLGSSDTSKSDFRIVVALNRDPLDLVEEGVLREDLYYALAIGRTDLPALRERGTDIIRLAEVFLQEFIERHGREPVTLSLDCKQVLLDCAWPGNLRQLRNVIEHALLMSSESRELTPSDLPEEVLTARWSRQPQSLTEEVIRAALRRTHNNRSQAADLLGVGRTTLWRAMKRLEVA